MAVLAFTAAFAAGFLLDRFLMIRSYRVAGSNPFFQYLDQQMKTHLPGDPIQTDFCFLVRNAPLFARHRFTTSADVSFGIDSAVLKSNKCPEAYAQFRLTASAKTQISKLPKHGTIGNMTLPATFDGFIVSNPENDRPPKSFFTNFITIEHITSCEANQ